LTNEEFELCNFDTNLTKILMTFKSIFIVLLFLQLGLVSCSSDPLNVDASDVEVNIDFINMDSLLAKSNANQILKYHRKWMVEIPEVYEYERVYCLQINSSAENDVVTGIQNFYKDPFAKRVHAAINRQFADLTFEKEQLIDGFKHLKYHFNDGKIPSKIVFINSCFNVNSLSTTKEIAIGLDRNLDSKTDVIKELPGSYFPSWIKEAWNRDFLVRDAICSWVMTHYVMPKGEETDNVDFNWAVNCNLAENMIRWGKIMYLTKAALPAASNAIILRYSEEDYKWAQDNEVAFWKYLVDQNFLFKKDEMMVANLLNDGPFTVGLPEKGPDRLGQYLGFRLVEEYVKNTECSPNELLQTNYEAIITNYEID
jgi:hypothetical protein